MPFIAQHVIDKKFVLSLMQLFFQLVRYLWVMKIKKPTILCVHSTLRLSEQSTKARVCKRFVYSIVNISYKILWLSSVTDTFFEKFMRCPERYVGFLGADWLGEQTPITWHCCALLKTYLYNCRNLEGQYNSFHYRLLEYRISSRCQKRSQVKVVHQTHNQTPVLHQSPLGCCKYRAYSVQH